jgi:hypothetical protein
MAVRVSTITKSKKKGQGPKALEGTKEKQIYAGIVLG